ncbi:ABC transporter substrate-binding protein [Microbacterium rhizomatis]|uniref:Sugar ABC transporter substrate-binding protein n=1 Tax=Microbacterium rhizomatis TaxID=1631477 RepID=A0A5J5IYB2_9MICO|nr:sugar ABC transporter substrate-binding protein [Microbacterium rhizomatis]KAA9106602.1 sugar ABC transporter substrate-binding protein [Microbacterium rhizomatis]
MSYSRPRRRLLRGAALTAALALSVGALAACAPGGSAPVSTAGASSGPVTLTWWDYYADGSASSEQLQALLKQYEEENPDVTINREFIAYADLKQSLLQSAGAGSLPDLVVINSPDHQQFAELGLAAKLDDKIAEWGQLDKYPEGVIASATYQDSIYGLPASANCLALFYNKAMFDAAGLKPPTTWAEMEKDAAALTTPEHYGLAYSAINNQQAVFQYLPALWQSGSDLDDLTSDAAVSSLDYWAGMMDKGSVSREALNWDQAAVATEFAQGRAAMMINGPWQLPFLAKEAPSLEYGVALLPSGKEDASVTGGENYMVMASPNEDAAWKVLQFLQQPENVTLMNVAGGSLPTRSDIDPFPDNEVIGVFTDQLQVARPRAYGANYAEIADKLVVALQSRMTGAATSKDALKTASDAIAPLLP